ncbi:MAG: asparaginase domain-containing protein, partial [Actinoallomurus sp.]
WQVTLPSREPAAEPSPQPPAGVVPSGDVAPPADGSAEVAPPADRASDGAPPTHVAAHAAPSADAPDAAAPPAGGETGTGSASPETSSRLVIVFAPDGSSPMVDAPPPGVTVERRPAAGPVSTFAGVGELTRTVGHAVAGGAHGVVVVHPAETLAETAWALELVQEGTAPIVLTAASGAPADLADAVAVAAAGPEGLGCVVVAHGEIHAARHVTATGLAAPAFASPAAGPLGQVIGGMPRLLWRPPERFTVRGPFAGRPPRVGLHVLALGDDGELLRTLAGHCDGLIVAARAGQSAMAALAPVLAEPAARIPVVLASPTVPPGGGMAATRLDPLKARVLMHLLLNAGHDRTAVLNAFTALEGNTTVPSPTAAAFG